MVTVLVSDSGSPVLGALAQVNVTVCLCDTFGDCKSEAGAVLGSSVGLSFIALIIILASVALLLRKSDRRSPERQHCTRYQWGTIEGNKNREISTTRRYFFANFNKAVIEF